MIKCISYFNSVLKCSGRGRSRVKCYILPKLSKNLSSRYLIYPSWVTGTEVNTCAPAPLISQIAREHDEQEAKFYISDGCKLC